MIDERVMRYRGPGLVDFGIGLGSPTPIMLEHEGGLDLMLGSRVWPMEGRDSAGLPRYGASYSAGLPDHLGWTLHPDRLTKTTAAFWESSDGTPRELWALGRGRIERYAIERGLTE